VVSQRSTKACKLFWSRFQIIFAWHSPWGWQSFPFTKNKNWWWVYYCFYKSLSCVLGVNASSTCWGK